MQGLLTDSSHQSIEGESLPPQQSVSHTSHPHWKSTLPSTITLRCGPFGTLDLDEAAFDTIAFFRIDSSFLTTNNISNLTTAHPPICQLQHEINNHTTTTSDGSKSQSQTGPCNQKLTHRNNPHSLPAYSTTKWTSAWSCTTLVATTPRLIGTLTTSFRESYPTWTATS